MKPNNVSYKDWFISIIAKEKNLEINDVKLIVDFQFTELIKTMKVKDKNSLEISGFGKFYFNYNKALKKINMYNLTKDKYKKILETESNNKSIQYKLKTLQININELNIKLYGNKI